VTQRLFCCLFVLVALPATGLYSQELEQKPADPYFAPFIRKKAPTTSGLILKPGDRLAICGDSITEQKTYSRIIETYLRVAVPELDITVRQFGWSGETAAGFFNRMANDCLRFKPTIATTSYGMNDHGYRPYTAEIGERYKSNSLNVVRAFKDAGARVAEGSPGCIGKVPSWTHSEDYSKEDLNLNLGQLRNIAIDVARSENVYFADVFWPMLTQDYFARKRYGEDYAVPGKDGVHPGWSGALIMAYAYLKSFGLDGEIGTLTVDLDSGKATASKGHEITRFSEGELHIRSARYPFCAPGGDIAKDDNIRSGMSLVPFNAELNRLTLIVKGGKAERYKVEWGSESKSFSQDQLRTGINLAEEFPSNPFCDAFAKVDRAVAAKQDYETRQIKELFHGPEGRADRQMTAELTEKARAPLADAVKAAFVPVDHLMKITAE
jgi:lysophospholipase L1-like esterase